MFALHNHYLKMTLMDFPSKLSSAGQKALAVPSPHIVEKLYVYCLCKFADGRSEGPGGPVAANTGKNVCVFLGIMMMTMMMMLMMMFVRRRRSEVGEH